MEVRSVHLPTVMLLGRQGMRKKSRTVSSGPDLHPLFSTPPQAGALQSPGEAEHGLCQAPSLVQPAFSVYMVSLPHTGPSRQGRTRVLGLCLENSMDRGTWWATVHGVAESRTQPSRWASASAIPNPPTSAPPLHLTCHLKNTFSSSLSSDTLTSRNPSLTFPSSGGRASLYSCLSLRVLLLVSHTILYSSHTILILSSSLFPQGSLYLSYCLSVWP